MCAHGGRACVSVCKCRRVQSWAVRVKLINRDQRTTKVREVGMALRCCRMHVFDAMPNACVDARLFAIVLRMCVYVMHLYHISYVSLSTYPGNELILKYHTWSLLGSRRGSVYERALCFVFQHRITRRKILLGCAACDTSLIPKTRRCATCRSGACHWHKSCSPDHDKCCP